MVKSDHALIIRQNKTKIGKNLSSLTKKLIYTNKSHTKFIIYYDPSYIEVF